MPRGDFSFRLSSVSPAPAPNHPLQRRERYPASGHGEPASICAADRGDRPDVSPVAKPAISALISRCRTGASFVSASRKRGSFAAAPPHRQTGIDASGPFMVWPVNPK
jgi:hypothetical protein